MFYRCGFFWGVGGWGRIGVGVCVCVCEREIKLQHCFISYIHLMSKIDNQMFYYASLLYTQKIQNERKKKTSFTNF